MELRYTVIDPTKNITLLVTTPVPRDVQPRVAAELLRRERTPSRWALSRAWPPEIRGCR